MAVQELRERNTRKPNNITVSPYHRSVGRLNAPADGLFFTKMQTSLSGNARENTVQLIPAVIRHFLMQIIIPHGTDSA